MHAETVNRESWQPELPPFLQKRQSIKVAKKTIDSPYLDLLERLKGELGFQKQQTAMRWLLEQLSSSNNLRKTILDLLQDENA